MKSTLLACVLAFGVSTLADEPKPILIKVSSENAAEKVGTALATLAADSGLKMIAVEVDENNNEIPGGQAVVAEPKPSESWTKLRYQLGLETGTTGPVALSLAARALRGTVQASADFAPMESYGFTVTLDPVSAFNQNFIVRPTVSYKNYKAIGVRIDSFPQDGETEYKRSSGILYGVKTRRLLGGTMEAFAQGGRGNVEKSIWNIPEGYLNKTDDQGQSITTKRGNIVVVGVSFFLNR